MTPTVRDVLPYRIYVIAYSFDRASVFMRDRFNDHQPWVFVNNAETLNGLRGEYVLAVEDWGLRDDAPQISRALMEREMLVTTSPQELPFLPENSQ